MEKVLLICSPLYNELRVKKYVPIGIVIIANVKPSSLNITDLWWELGAVDIVYERELTRAQQVRYWTSERPLFRRLYRGMSSHLTQSFLKSWLEFKGVREVLLDTFSHTAHRPEVGSLSTQLCTDQNISEGDSAWARQIDRFDL